MALRKSKSDPVLKSTETESHPPAPSADDSAPGRNARTSTSARHMSLKQLATFLNRDRNTVMKYLDQGMPAVEKADRDRGAAWVIDSADAVRWLEERAAKAVAERLGLDGGDTKSVTKEEAERRDIVARMIIREADAAESVRMVAKISDLLDVIRDDYATLRLNLMAVPDTLAGKVDPKVAAAVRDISETLIRDALKELVGDAWEQEEDEK